MNQPGEPTGGLFGVVAVLMAWTAIVATALAVNVTSAQALTTNVNVQNTTTTGVIPNGFVGLALEYSTPPKWIGSGPDAPNPVFVQLLRNLVPSGRPVIRVGGGSTERTWWPIAGETKPLGVTYSLTPQWVTEMHALAQAVDAKLLLSVNLEAGQPLIAQTEADQFLAGIGRQYLSALEIGNEPEFYNKIPWYKVLDGKPVAWYSKLGRTVLARPLSFGPTQWAKQYARTLSLMPAGIPIAGPDTGNTMFLSAFRPFVTARKRVKILVSHAYGLTNCQTIPTAPQYPSVPNLLAEQTSRSLVSSLTPYIALAHANGETFRIDEMGSISCNGKLGVSNTMASGLWLLDSLMSLWSSHVDGVNLHTFPREINNLFDFVRPGGKWTGIVHPLYYGALMFEQAAPPGSRLLDATSSDEAPLRAWATVGDDGTIRVTLINDTLRQQVASNVTVPQSASGGAGQLLRMTATSAYATQGIEIGGASFGARTPTGVLPPTVTQKITPHGGVYRVTLPPSSAAILTIPAKCLPNSYHLAGSPQAQATCRTMAISSSTP